jgi:DNA-binding NtrC family response regulator
MADLSGPAVVARVRPHRPRLPVVLVSGGGHPDGAAELLGDPLVRFLAKPFSPSELVRVVSGLLAGRAEGTG